MKPIVYYDAIEDVLIIKVDPINTSLMRDVRAEWGFLRGHEIGFYATKWWKTKLKEGSLIKLGPL